MSVNTDATSLSDKNLTMAPQCEAAPYTDCVTVHGYGELLFRVDNPAPYPSARRTADRRLQ